MRRGSKVKGLFTGFLLTLIAHFSQWMFGGLEATYSILWFGKKQLSFFLSLTSYVLQQ